MELLLCDLRITLRGFTVLFQTFRISSTILLPLSITCLTFDTLEPKNIFFILRNDGSWRRELRLSSLSYYGKRHIVISDPISAIMCEYLICNLLEYKMLNRHHTFAENY